MNGSMKTQTKLQARAILLEQFKNGVNGSKVALKAVLNELGPKSMSKKSAIFWYKRFQKSDFSLGKGASKTDQKLIDASTFLDMKRALFCTMIIESDWYNFLEVTGTNGRFQFLSTGSYSDRSYWVLDTFHSRQKRLTLDWSELCRQSSTVPLSPEDGICMKQIHFIDEKKCLVIFGSWRWYIVTATFNIATSTMKLEEYRHLPTIIYYSLFTDTQPVGLLEASVDAPMCFTTINVEVDLKLKDQVDLGPTLWLTCATRRDETIIGFNDGDWTIDFKSLVTISLTDGRVSTRPTNLSEELNDALNRQRKESFVWIKEKLFTYASSHDSMSTIYVFDLGTLEWKNTGIQLPGLIEHMSSADDNVLIVNVTKSYRNKWKEVYRFAIFGPDSLLNLSWMTARRRAQSEPEYYNQSLQKLPTYCHVRCPWQDDSQ